MTAPTRRVQAMIDLISDAFPKLGTDVLDAAEARALLTGPARREPRPMPRVDEFVARGVRVRGYWPEGLTDDAPALIFLHGGGFVLCGLDSHDAICRDLAAQCGVVVFSVEYRLAPEHPFPAAFDDAYATTLDIVARASEFGVDPARIGVAGDSAGGNLAAAVALHCRDAGGPALVAQVLIYPMLDPAQDTDSYRRYAHGWFVTADHLRWYWDCYRGAGSPDPDARFAPPAAASLAGLPPALVVVAGCDPLGDEAREYARRLSADGTEADLLDCAGLFHGFLGFGEQLPEVAEVVDQIYAKVRALVSQPSRSRK